jgi:hypothetical protein
MAIIVELDFEDDGNIIKAKNRKAYIPRPAPEN